MKIFLPAIFLTLTLTNAHAGPFMKLEGSCSGTLKNGEPVAFQYYSTFDGCKEKSSAGVSFSAGIEEGLMTGKRYFKGEKDHYSFKEKKKEIVHLTFADSTGNTEGKIRYIDEDGKRQSVTVLCEIRDYEYADC